MSEVEPGRDAKAALELKGVVRTFRQGSEAVEALRGLSLAVAAGEMVGLVGPSPPVHLRQLAHQGGGVLARLQPRPGPANTAAAAPAAQPVSAAPARRLC